MKTITIKKLAIEHFKGIKELTIEFSGATTNIYGDNATGKTSIFDAYLWLLFGKDSQGRADFEAKPLDKDGEPIHGVETKVEGTFSVDGKPLVLSKVYKEKWTKKRGQAKPVFTGHTTEHFVDGLPVSKKKYDETVRELLNEKTFHLLSDITYFNEKIKWEERRRILLDVCGNITDADVIASDPKFSPLSEFLERQTPEERKKILQQDARRINKELEQIPVRISEQERILSGSENLPDEEYLRGILDEKKALLKEKQAELLRAENNAQVIDLQKKRAELQRKINLLEAEHKKVTEKVEKERKDALYQKEKKVNDLKAEISRTDEDIEHKENTAKEVERRLVELRKLWDEENGREFEYTPEPVCPTCGQELPSDKVEEARKKALEEFNRTKSENLARITKEGKATREKLEIVRKELQSLRQKKEALEKLKKEAESEAISLIEEPLIYPEPPDELFSLVAEAERLDSLIEQSKGEEKPTESIREAIRQLESEIKEVESKVASYDVIRKAQARIEELRKEERDLAEQYENIQEEIYLLEEFTRRKVSFIEERVSELFSLSRFRLFEEQINGGLKETCEVTYDGIPYQNLNNGMRINIGLDVINALSRFYGVSVPVWVDNAESVTSLINTNGQIIRLVVSEQDKALRITNENKEVKNDGKDTDGDKEGNTGTEGSNAGSLFTDERDTHAA